MTAAVSTTLLPVPEPPARARLGAGAAQDAFADLLTRADPAPGEGQVAHRDARQPTRPAARPDSRSALPDRPAHHATDRNRTGAHDHVERAGRRRRTAEPTPEPTPGTARNDVQPVDRLHGLPLAGAAPAAGAGAAPDDGPDPSGTGVSGAVAVGGRGSAPAVVVPAGPPAAGPAGSTASAAEVHGAGESALPAAATRTAGPATRTAGPTTRAAGPTTRAAGPTTRAAGPTTRAASTDGAASTGAAASTDGAAPGDGTPAGTAPAGAGTPTAGAATGPTGTAADPRDVATRPTGAAGAAGGVVAGAAATATGRRPLERANEPAAGAGTPPAGQVSPTSPVDRAAADPSAADRPGADRPGDAPSTAATTAGPTPASRPGIDDVAAPAGPSATDASSPDGPRSAAGDAATASTAASGLPTGPTPAGTSTPAATGAATGTDRSGPGGTALPAVDATAAALAQPDPTVAGSPLTPGGLPGAAGDVRDAKTVRNVQPALLELAKGLRSTGAGHATLVVRLDPPELGPVLVRVVLRNGTVSVSCRSADSGAVTVLQQQHGDVQEALRKEGFDLAGYDVRQQSTAAGGDTPSRDTPGQRTDTDTGGSAGARRDQTRDGQPAGPGTAGTTPPLRRGVPAGPSDSTWL